MAKNKFVYFGQTLIDLSEDDVTAGDVAQGKKFHLPSGEASVGTAQGGSGATVKTASINNSSNTAKTLTFNNISARPKAFVLRLTTTISSSGSTAYYYVVCIDHDGTNTKGTYFRIGSTRAVYNDTTHYSFTYSGTTLTISTSGSRTGAGGSFYNGTYELIYCY